MMHALSLIYAPYPDAASAQAATDAVLAHGLAACVNILGTAVSHYMWQGVPTQAHETILLFKTPAAKSEQLTAWLRANHPYETPCILVLSATANPEFAQWADLATKTVASGENIR